MERFVHRENLAHYRRLLAEPDVTDDQARHKVLMQLLADETASEASLMEKDKRTRLPRIGRLDVSAAGPLAWLSPARVPWPS